MKEKDIRLPFADLGSFSMPLSHILQEVRITPQRYRNGFLSGLAPGAGPIWGRGYSEATGTFGIRGIVSTTTDKGWSETRPTDDDIIRLAADLEPTREAFSLKIERADPHPAVQALLSRLVERLDVAFPGSGVATLVEMQNVGHPLPYFSRHDQCAMVMGWRAAKLKGGVRRADYASSWGVSDSALGKFVTRYNNGQLQCDDS